MARSRILNKIKYGLTILKKDIVYGLQTMIWVIMTKDPCDICIVKACCKEYCELKVEVINTCYPYETLKGAKIFSSLVLTILIGAVIILLFCIYKAIVS